MGYAGTGFKVCAKCNNFYRAWHKDCPHCNKEKDNE